MECWSEHPCVLRGREAFRDRPAVCLASLRDAVFNSRRLQGLRFACPWLPSRIPAGCPEQVLIIFAIVPKPSPYAKRYFIDNDVGAGLVPARPAPSGAGNHQQLRAKVSTEKLPVTDGTGRAGTSPAPTTWSRKYHIDNPMCAGDPWS